jgi:uncharacterized protein YkwD
VPAARHIVTAALAAALLITPASAYGKSAPKKGKQHPTATVALGDKRAPRAKADKSAPKAAATQSCANTDLMPTADNLDEIRDAVLCLHNQIRASKGLPALKENSKLRNAAVGHSADMVEEGFFDHTDPDGDTFVDRILAAKYAKQTDGWTLGENLAWGTGDLSTPAGVMNAWMSSAGHKANILKRSYREIGIGVRLGVPSDAGVGATFTADFGAKS